MTCLRGDITHQRVDAIVNAANRRMRGGGGVDGAIHRAGGPEVLADCIARFPHGLQTGEAGWTTAGRLPARWVIHTVGPDYGAGERDPALLESCYRRSLEVADELGARSVAFPLVSAGVYRWPRTDAVRIAVHTLLRTPTRVEEARIVAFNDEIEGAVRAELVQAREEPLTAFADGDPTPPGRAISGGSGVRSPEPPDRSA
ncbi:O-acetyl-ADP-ribose deacetylase [Microbacterium soli]|uniref:O-acetyl-ADP-ribose deacetylase n=1 Tax=Microbacterium soli TaxID=446075 RepID=A0ABP7MN76_9MICO